MAQAAKKDTYVYAPSRVYSYSRAATAEALPEAAPAPHRGAPRPAHPAPRTRVKREPSPAMKRKQRFVPKLVSVIEVFAATALIIFIVVQYSLIAGEYNELNDIRSDIEASKLRIAELEVQLDSAVNVEEAREAAEKAGLDYPSAGQIVDVDGVIGGYEQTGDGGN